MIAKYAAESGRYAAVVCLGAVIRGETDHYDYVCGEAARGIQQVQLETGVPCGFGVLTVDNMEQALEPRRRRLQARHGPSRGRRRCSRRSRSRRSWSGARGRAGFAAYPLSGPCRRRDPCRAGRCGVRLSLELRAERAQRELELLADDARSGWGSGAGAAGRPRPPAGRRTAAASARGRTARRRT